MTSERAIRFLIFQAAELQKLAYKAGHGNGPDRDTLESFLILPKSIGAAMKLAPMDAVEARMFMFQLKQELIGENAHQHEEAA